MKPLHERRRRSARQRFSECAHSYADEYVRGNDNSSPEARRGDAFHWAKQIYIRALWRKGLTDDHEIASLALAEALRSHPLPLAMELDLRELWARFSERFVLPLKSYYDVETELPMFQTILRFDLVTVPKPSTLLIDDSKTNWNIPSESALRDGWQTRMYLTAARLLFPDFAHYQMTYTFERYGQVVGPIELSPAELDAFEETIAASDEAMERAEAESVYPATGGAWCGQCAAECPLLSTAGRMTLERLQTPQDATAVIGLLASLHRRQAVLRQALQGYVDASGEGVEANGIRWAYRPVEMTRYPAVGVAKALETGGFPEQVAKLTVSGSTVKRFVTSKGKYKAVEDAIKALAVTKVSTEFGPRITALEDEAPTPEDEN